MPEHVDALGAKLLTPDITDRVFAAVDKQSRRHVLVKLKDEDADVRDTQSRGISIDTRELATATDQITRYADIVCLDPLGYDSFDLVAAEIAQKLATSDTSASDVILRVIAKWRRFWNSGPRQVLSPSEVLGLFAELWFLRHWLLPNLSPAAAVSAWRGPFGSRHDFEFARNAVEVKATLARSPVTHHINGLDQLVHPVQGDLFFFSLAVAQEVTASESLPQLIDSLVEVFVDCDDVQSDLFSRLAHAGYNAADSTEYLSTRFRIAHAHLYLVTDGFPKIIPSTFAGPTLSGVSQIEYDISLNGFDDLIIARSPSLAIGRRIAQV